MSDEPEKDDLRGDLAAALEGTLGTQTTETTGTTETQQTTTAETTQTEDKAADRGDGRDDKGRFAPKPGETPRETLTLKPKEGDPAKPAQQQAKPQTPKDLANELQHGAEPPIEWKGQAKIDFKRLPPAVQASIRETMDGIQSANAELSPLKELIDVNRQMLVNEAGSVPEAFRQLLAMHKLSLERPLDLCAHILQRRGIDPRTAFSGQPQQGTQEQPGDINSLIRQAVQQAVQPYVAQQQHTESQQYVSQIQAFAADAAAHPYFNDVKADMAVLLKGGRAQNLQEAYDQAIWGNPSIRSQLIARQTEDVANTRTAEVAAAQRAASASLTGSPAPGAQQVNGLSGSDGSIRGDLQAAMRAVSGAV